MAKTNMWFYEKIMVGMSIVTAILVAIMDGKLTIAEIINIVNTAISGFGSDLKLKPSDLEITPREDGGLNIGIGPDVVKHLEIKF